MIRCSVELCWWHCEVVEWSWRWKCSCECMCFFDLCDSKSGLGL